jgi:hypothetical protein
MQNRNTFCPALGQGLTNTGPRSGKENLTTDNPKVVFFSFLNYIQEHNRFDF